MKSSEQSNRPIANLARDFHPVLEALFRLLPLVIVLRRHQAIEQDGEKLRDLVRIRLVNNLGFVHGLKYSRDSFGDAAGLETEI
jgi:hypothetical protein